MIVLIDTIVYAGRIKNQLRLMNSSSGGAFTALSEYFLENNDAVIASIYNYDIYTTEFRLILDKDQREEAKGSKYMQSKPGNVFEKSYEWIMENSQKNYYL